jgi:3-oxoacyl-[acyl-carrier protein] reductase
MTLSAELRRDLDLGLKDKVAWVHGASSGLGLATAAALAREGARVAISARRADVLGRLAGELGEIGPEVIAVPVDVRDPDAITDGATRVRARLGPVEILIANAGGPPPGGFDAFDEDAVLDAFTLTTMSAWRLAKAVVDDMRSTGRGVIIFLTSGSTKEVVPSLLLSNMMRPAVVGLAKTLSKELGPQGIRVLCAAPGRIATPRLIELDEAAAARTGRSVDEVKEANVAAIPLGRYGAPEEFGEVVAFLSSERASFVSGVSVSIDGAALNGLLA